MAARAALGAILLKLIQLNIWQGKLLLAVSRFLQKQDADIVCMQEVMSSPVHLGALDLLTSLETLKQDLDYEHVYYEPTFSFDTSGVRASMGNAIFSKFPLVNRRVIFTNNNYHDVHNWERDHPANTRNGRPPAQY